MTDDADPNPGHADPNPGPADPNPGQLVAAAVDRCLELARTWHAWDGRPIARTMDDGLPNTWTPHKALRRIADHLVDHLHQVESLLAGATPLPDEWLGRTVTVDADWSRFTEPDYAEACSRLRYTRSVAFTKSEGFASGMLTKVCGLRSVSGNHELWICTMMR